MKAMVLEKLEKRRGYELLNQERQTFKWEKPSFRLFQICLELAEAFHEYEELGRYFLQLAKKNSEILPRLVLVNAEHDRWAFSEDEIENSEELREKLRNCYHRLPNISYMYGHKKL